MWGWGRAGMILVAALLFRHAVAFDQAVILILLNVVLDRLVYGKQPSSRSQKRTSAAMAENRRRPTPRQPIKRRPVRSGDELVARGRRTVSPAGSERTGSCHGTYRKAKHQ